MKRSAVPIPAPKRGRYDRVLTRHERQAAQRERVVAAIMAVCSSGRELSVTNVVEHAGIGRNTFYEYFDDIEHALSLLHRRALHELATRIDAALSLARTPLDRVLAVARAWGGMMFEEPALAELALRPCLGLATGEELSVLGRHVALLLQGESESPAGLSGLGDSLRVTAVAALFEVISRTHLAARTMPRDEFQRVLADLSLRLLR